MKIVELHAENVKRIRAVSIRPDGSMVVVGGDNAEGKTSVLDSIAYALGGKALMCQEPLRKGANKGTARVDLGDLVVSRTFTKGGGGSLKVESRTEGVLKSPQALLDKLVGSLTFDPLAFSRMDPKDQAETLRRVVGLDLTEHDKDRAQTYEARTQVNRTLSHFKAKLADMEFHDDAPDQPVSMEALLVEHQDATAKLGELDQLRIHQAQAEERAAAASDAVARLDDQIEALRRSIVEYEAQREKAKADTAQHYANAQEVAEHIEAKAAELPKIADIQARMQGAEEANFKWNSNKEYRIQEQAIRQKTDEAARLTQVIADIDAEKARKIGDAQFPVEGLGFDEAGVTMNGLPFDQASSAEQLRVSVGMGFAMNPDLRILLIRDGSLLDQGNLALVAQLAEEADGQVWIERVGVDGSTSVVIEDGEVKERLE